MRAGVVEGQPPVPGLSPSCSNRSSKLGAAMGYCGILHWDALGRCTGTLHWDAPGLCAPTLPPSKLPPCRIQLLLHGSSIPPHQHLPLPQAPAAPLHSKGAKEGCAGRSCPGDGASDVCLPPWGTLPGQGGPSWVGEPNLAGSSIISLASLSSLPRSRQTPKSAEPGRR